MRFQHWIVHAGKAFSINKSWENVANGASKDLIVTVHATTELHVRAFDLNVTGGATILLYETPTVNVGAPGTALTTAMNKNRNLATTVTDHTWKYDPTIDAVGTLMWSSFASTGKNNFGESSTDAEWILCCGKTYLLRVTNTSGGNINITETIFAYDEK